MTDRYCRATASRDIELLMLRHEVAGGRRTQPRPRLPRQRRILGGQRLTSGRSVFAKSSPVHSNGSPAREAIAYVQQSPKFKAAGCLPLPKRE